MARSEILDATTPESRDLVVKYIKSNYPDLKDHWKDLYEMVTTPDSQSNTWKEKAKSLSKGNRPLENAFFKIAQVVQKNESGELGSNPDTWQVGVEDFNPQSHVASSEDKVATPSQRQQTQPQQQGTAPPPPAKQSTYMDAVNRGVAKSLSRLDRFAANVVGMLPFTESTSRSMSERAAQVEKEAEEQYGAPLKGETGKEITEALSGIPVDLLRYALPTRVLGPLGPFLGPALTEYMTNIHLGHDKAKTAMWHGIAMGLGAKYGGKAASKLYGKTMLKNINLLPDAIKNRLPSGFVDAFKEMAEEGAGAGIAGAGMRAATGEEITPGNVVTDIVVGTAAPKVARGAEKIAGRVAKEYRDYRDWKKGKPSPQQTTTTPPPTEEPPMPTAQATAEPAEGVLPKAKDNTVVDPLTGKTLQLEPNESAVFTEDTTYIFKPRGIEGKYDVFEASTEGGKERRLVNTSRDVTDLAAEAARLRKEKASLGKEPEPFSQPKTTSAAEATEASVTPSVSSSQLKSAFGMPQKKEEKKTPPTAAPKPAPAVSPIPAAGSKESAYTDTPKGKPQRTVAIKFENEQQKTLYDTIQNARTGDANAVTAKAEAVNKYAQENNVSTEEAQNILEGWATKTFMRAKNQPAEAPEGKRLEIEANPVPKPSNKKPAATPPPPAAAAPAAAPEPVKPETVTTETVVTPAPAATLPPPPVVEAATSQPQVEPPAVTPEVSATPAPEPIAPPTPPAKKATGKKKAAPTAGIPPVAAKAEEEVTTELPPAAIPTGMVEAAAAGTAARVKPPVPEGSEGMQSYSIRQNTPLYFENSNDLAIAKSGGKSQDLRKHVNKLGSLLLDGKPIVMQPDKAVQLMRDYRSHLTEVSSGVVPSIEEFATTIWKEKGRAALPQELAPEPKASISKEEKKLDKDIASINEQIKKEEDQRRGILNTQPDVSRGITQRMLTADALAIANKIKKLKGQLSTLLWRKQRGLTGQVAQTAKQPEPITELANIRRSIESSSRIADSYEKELGQINKQIGEVVAEKIKLKGEAGKPASQKAYANQLKNTIEKYQQDLNVLKQERAAREAERKENDNKSADISEQIKDLSPQDPVYINGKKRISQLSQRNQQLTEEIGSRDARQKQVEGDIENETVKLNSGKLPTQIEIDKDIARLDAKLEQLKKDRDKTDASLSQAKKDSVSNKSLIDSFLKSEAGKAAIEQEKKSQLEKQEEQKRISQWSKRYRSSAIPGFETVERPPIAGTFAEQVSKMEPAAVPEYKTVPTVESLARNKVKIQDISEALEEAKTTLTIRRRFEDTQTRKLDNLLEQIESQHDAVLAVSGGEPSVSSIKRAESQLANEQKRLDQLNKNIEQAKASLERGNLSDVRKRILEEGIRNRITSVNILKESIARLNLIIEKIPGVPESYTAEQALKRRGIGTFSAAQIREQNRLDKLTKQFYQINENLKKYREKNLNRSYQDVQQLSKKLLDLHAEHSQMRERLSEVPGMTSNDINKLLEDNIKSISKLGKDTDAVGQKYNEAIEDIGKGVAKLQEKFEKTTAAKESEAQGPKTPESAITDEVYEKAVNATKEKKNVTRPFLRSVLSEYKLGKKSIDALMSRMKSEGVIDKSGILIEEVKPEPLPEPKVEPKPAKETKPKQTRKKEEVKPETKPEVKPEVKPEEKKTAKESPEVKISGSKFAREEDAKMYQAWIKNSDSFIRDNPGMAQKAITQLVEANEGLNKQKAMIALGKYMEAVNSMIIQKKPVPSLLDWYSKNK